MFEIISPSPALSLFVKNYWMLHAGGIPTMQERILPTGFVSLMFHRGGRMFSSAENKILPRSFVAGQSSSFTDMSSEQGIDLICVVFQPHGARVFLNLPIHELQNISVSIDDLDDENLKLLERQLFDAQDIKSCVKYIETFLYKRLYDFESHNFNRLQAALDAAGMDSEARVSGLSDISCLSQKQFGRIFSEYVGLNPKEFLRIVRFQRVLYILQHNRNISLTQLAFEAGYYDQPHLIREFKAMTGQTPTELLASCDPFSDYFS